MGNIKSITNTEKDPGVDWLAGVEVQESKGQSELVASSQLPRNVNYPRGAEAKKLYAEMGIKVISESKGDDLFFDVNLPKGWKIERTEHSMWSNLINDSGESVASIFYKAAFYDRDAFINFN